MRLDKFLPVLLFLSSSLALAERREKVEIPKEQGISLIAPLLSGEESNTTNLRVEKKNIISLEKINQYLKPFLQKNPENKRKYQFTIRDKSLKRKEA